MKILIVDNEASTVTTLKALLLSQGTFDIETAYSGQESLDKMIASDYDLVLLDIMMPKMSGLDVCQQMDNDSRLNRMPVLLMSSALPLPPADFRESLAKFQVVKGVLEKPFTAEELKQEINRIAHKI